MCVCVCVCVCSAHLQVLVVVLREAPAVRLGEVHLERLEAVEAHQVVRAVVPLSNKNTACEDARTRILNG